MSLGSGLWKCSPMKMGNLTKTNENVYCFLSQRVQKKAGIHQWTEANMLVCSTYALLKFGMILCMDVSVPIFALHPPLWLLWLWNFTSSVHRTHPQRSRTIAVPRPLLSPAWLGLKKGSLGSCLRSGGFPWLIRADLPGAMRPLLYIYIYIYLYIHIMLSKEV